MRLLAFIDPVVASSMALLEATLKAADTRNDVELIGVVDTARSALSPLWLPRVVATRKLRLLLNLSTAAEPEDVPRLRSASALLRGRAIPLLAPHEAGINDASFVESVRQLRPDAALSLMVAQVFRAPLLDACQLPVNYHPGMLPHYRGVGATGWSIYDGAPRSGLSFHLMSEQVDQGAVLLQRDVALTTTSAAAPVERAKTQLACSMLDELFDLLVAPSRTAKPQDGPGSGFSRAQMTAIRTVEQPERLTLAEHELRLRAFEVLDLTIAGQRWRVTALRQLGSGADDNRPLAFTTADGVRVEPSRLLHLPPVAYRVLRPLLSAARPYS